MDFIPIAQQQASRDWTDTIVPWIVVAVLLIGAVVIGYANFQNARPFRLESSTTLPPAEALNALQSQMARDGWNLGFREGNSLVMNITHPASFGSTAALGCLSIWLALLYLVTRRKTVVVQVDASDSGNGTQLVTIGDRSGQILKYMATRVRELPK